MKKLIIPAALALCCVPLAACAVSSTHLHYDFADQYSSGGAALDTPVRHLDIHWLNGSVDVQYHDEPHVSFYETASRVTDETTVMRYWLEGDTLHIQFGADGMTKPRNLRKNLYLYLPKGEPLQTCTIDTVSAAVYTQDLSADALTVSTVSGSIEARHTTVTQRAVFGTTSGAVTLHLTDTIDQLELSSVSGRIDVFAERVEWLRVKTGSGRIQLSTDCTAHSDISSISGAMDIVQRETAGSASIGTTSGKVTLQLPEDAGFTLQTSTLSGRVICDFAGQSVSGRTIVGSGEHLLKISTLSGKIHVTPYDPID